MSQSANGNPRKLALKVLTGVVRDGLSTGQTLPPAQQACSPRDRGLLQQLVMGSLQHWFGLQKELRGYLQKPLKGKDSDILCLLALGLFQLRHTRIPAHAAISETVNLCPKNKSWARGLCNAVLRRASTAEPPTKAAAELPDWLLKQIQQDWPQQQERILAGSTSPATMTLRAVTSRPELQAKLAEQGLKTEPHAGIESALTVTEAVDITGLASFTNGEFIVQDAAAQIAATLLAPKDSEQILDACAAPGGKTTHILQLAPQAQVTALDSEADRLKRVHENLERLKQTAKVIAADARDTENWAPNEPYDRILLDAPCSATGVIRRHPDIKLLRRESDIENLVALQAEILESLWQRLKIGGRLVYCTCSILKKENIEQVKAFLEKTADAKEISIESDWGHNCAVGKQIFPGDSGMDGFYYCVLEKQAAA
ncbi:MAG: 16S rRNA (cytosine(967)-C(5))-methyltransferase RsmB [Gammaproteobacteria bacterium]|nr:16S rRNA (cytosine(967)-C(5))-methyltransferase RsmB [Gammaproteobacteria bacterium]